MSFFVFNNPADLSWFTVLFDVVMTATFVIGVVGAVRDYRRGRVDHAFVMIAAFWYGLLLELSGMFWKDSYLQGDFPVMLNWGVFGIWENATMMPSYVPLFYPTIFFLGYRLLDQLGVTSLWKRAVTGGAIMGMLLDPMYIIQGNLDQSRWWTWDEWIFYQFWLGWPLADMWWQTSWGALFFFVIYRLRPRIDARFSARPWVFLAAAPVLMGIFMNIAGPVMHAPITIVTFAGGRQWWVMVVLMPLVALIALTAERRTAASVDRAALLGVAIFAVSFAAMQVGNVVVEDGLRFHTVVQSAAIVGLVLVALVPRLVSGSRSAREVDDAEDARMGRQPAGR